MADLGAIGSGSNTAFPANLPADHVGRTVSEINVIQAGSAELAAFAERDDTDGNPEPPCQKQTRAGLLKDIFVPVRAGVPVVIQVDCKYAPDADPRPRIILKANEAVGLFADVIGDAQPGAAWQTLQVGFTPTADGVVDVHRELRNSADGAYAKWDNAALVQ